MSEFISQLNQAGGRFTGHASAMLLQVSVLIAVLFVLDVVLRRYVRAVVRYWLWTLVLLKLALPVSLSCPTGLAYWLPSGQPEAERAREETSWQPATTAVAVPPVAGQLHARPRPDHGLPTAAASQRPAAAARQRPASIRASQTPTGIPAPGAPALPSWRAGLFLGWLLGVLLLGIWVVRRSLFVRSLIGRAEPADRHVVEILEACRGRLRVGRPIKLGISAETAVPAVCGLLRPTILLPAGFSRQVGAKQLKAVLMHELAHVQRGDLVVNLLQTVLQVVYFYNPLVWLANAMIRRVREKATDEAVLVALGEEAPQYSSTLIDVAERVFRRPVPGLGFVGVAESRRALAGRIRHIVGRPIPRTARLGVAGFAWIIAVAATLLPMAAAEPPAPIAPRAEEDPPATTKPPDDAPATREAGRAACSMEAQFGLDKPIPVLLTAAAGDRPDIFRLAWIVFRKEQSALRADLRAVIVSWPKGKWKVTVGLLNKHGRLVGERAAVCENSGKIAGYPFWSEHDIRFSFGTDVLRSEEVGTGGAAEHLPLSGITRFRIGLEPAPEGAKIDAELVPPPTPSRPKGELSLKIIVEGDVTLPSGSAGFVLWRQVEQVDDSPSSGGEIDALFGGRETSWREAQTDRIWEPVRSVGTTIDSPYTAEELVAGSYRVTAAMSGTEDSPTSTPVAVSRVIQLKDTTATPEVTVRLQTRDRYPLTVRLVDAATGKPLAHQYVVLRGPDGLMIDWQGIGPANFTDEKGQKHYAWLEPGAYTFEVGKSGWWGGQLFPESNVKRVQVEVKSIRKNEITVPYTPRGPMTSPTPEKPANRAEQGPPAGGVPSPAELLAKLKATDALYRRGFTIGGTSVYGWPKTKHEWRLSMGNGRVALLQRAVEILDRKENRHHPVLEKLRNETLIPAVFPMVMLEKAVFVTPEYCASRWRQKNPPVDLPEPGGYRHISFMSTTSAFYTREVLWVMGRGFPEHIREITQVSRNDDGMLKAVVTTDFRQGPWELTIEPEADWMIRSGKGRYCSFSNSGLKWIGRRCIPSEGVWDEGGPGGTRVVTVERASAEPDHKFLDEVEQMVHPPYSMFMTLRDERVWPSLAAEGIRPEQAVVPIRCKGIGHPDGKKEFEARQAAPCQAAEQFLAVFLDGDEEAVSDLIVPGSRAHGDLAGLRKAIGDAADVKVRCVRFAGERPVILTTDLPLGSDPALKAPVFLRLGKHADRWLIERVESRLEDPFTRRLTRLLSERG